MSSSPGIESAVRALRYWERRQEAVANNLANASTPGFKGERVFARLLEGAVPEALSQPDFRDGAAAPTGRPLDIALSGDAFLVVETPEGERLTRGGSLTLDAEGRLITQEGHPVLGESGPLVIPPGDVTIANDGSISVDGAALGSLRLDRPADGSRALREGGSLWRVEGTSESAAEGDVRVLQGHLEDSNVDPMVALVEMLEIQRAYGAIQRSLQTTDGVMNTIASEIGRIG